MHYTKLDFIQNQFNMAVPQNIWHFFCLKGVGVGDNNLMSISNSSSSSVGKFPWVRKMLIHVNISKSCPFKLTLTKLLQWKFYFFKSLFLRFPSDLQIILYPKEVVFAVRQSEAVLTRNGEGSRSLMNKIWNLHIHDTDMHTEIFNIVLDCPTFSIKYLYFSPWKNS